MQISNLEGQNMTEEQNAWGTVGYAAMLSSIFVGLMRMASALGNHDFRVFAAEYALFGVIHPSIQHRPSINLC